MARELGLGNRCVIVTNETVSPLYRKPVEQALVSAGIRTSCFELPDGETHKHLGSIERIMTFLIESGADRSTWLLALGGGVVGDITGFAAAVYLRGVPFVQVPTTLLAQVDSSVGGKTGVNHPAGKNLIGALHQPRFVLVDVATLQTLPQREFLSGLAEVIKYGIVLDRVFFEYLESQLPKILARERDTLLHLTTSCCQLKAQVVEQDERETGLRAVLNFGHTVGHAIESLSGYEKYTHGEAVAMGMVAAAVMAEIQGVSTNEDTSRIRRLITSAGLLVDMPSFTRQQLVQAIFHDKKMKEGVVTMVFNQGIGGYCLSPVSDLDGLLSRAGIGG
jgi:3-dehydroquinate synthase